MKNTAEQMRSVAMEIVHKKHESKIAYIFECIQTTASIGGLSLIIKDSIAMDRGVISYLAYCGYTVQEFPENMRMGNNGFKYEIFW